MALTKDEKALLQDVAESMARLDERSINIYTLTEKQERHLEKLNNHVAECQRDSASHSSSIKWIKLVLWAIVVVIVALIGGVAILPAIL